MRLVCIRVIVLLLASSLARYDFPCIIQEGTLGYDDIAEHNLGFITSTDPCHGCEAWFEFSKDRFEMQSRLFWTVAWGPGDVNSEELSLIVVNGGVAVFAFGLGAKRFLEANIAQT